MTADASVKAEGHKPTIPPDRVQRAHDIFEPATEDTFNLRFNAGKEFEENFNRLCEVLGIENACRNLENVLGKALKIALDEKDPKRRLERRQKREEKKKAVCREKSCLGDEMLEEKEILEAKEKLEKQKPEVSKTKHTAKKSKATRYISQEVKERVFEKAHHQCEYQSSEGVRCSSRTGLQIDHILPFAICHSNDEENLRILCKAHNHFTAEEFYGRRFIKQKIEEQRQKKTKRFLSLTSHP